MPLCACFVSSTAYVIIGTVRCFPHLRPMCGDAYVKLTSHPIANARPAGASSPITQPAEVLCCRNRLTGNHWLMRLRFESDRQTFAPGGVCNASLIAAEIEPRAGSPVVSCGGACVQQMVRDHRHGSGGSRVFNPCAAILMWRTSRRPLSPTPAC
jgi:hypothetical protein